MKVFDIESLYTGYLAAIIDGEGTIDLVMRDRGNYKDFLPYVVVFNTERSIIDNVNGMAGVGEVYELQRKDGHKTLYRLWIRRQEDIVSFLERIKLWLTSKRKQHLAELLIEYCRIRLESKHNSHTEREIEIWKEVRSLNKRVGGGIKHD